MTMRDAIILLLLMAGGSIVYSAGCDLNGDSLTNVADVQQCVNQAIGVASCTTGDIDGNSQCNVIDVQRVVNAALGGQCASSGAGGGAGGLPSGVTLRDIDGGADYYCSHGFTYACNAGWDTPSFFPIG